MPIFQITGIKIDECKCRCAKNALIIQNQSTMKATLFHLHIHTHVVVGHSKRKIYRFTRCSAGAQLMISPEN